MSLATMSREEMLAMKTDLMQEYEGYQARGLKLNMARGKPNPAQLDLSMPMLTVLHDEYRDSTGTDVRNYGGLDGIPEAKQLMADLMEIPAANTVVFGASSLNIMYDTVVRAMLFGTSPDQTPWSKQDKLKFLCPVPGYDRHFGICEQMGIEMINIPMLATGPDMDLIEKLVAADAAIKGIWCVPKYSNPEGISYSDDTVRRLAAMPTAAPDFRIFWDNAYCEHHLNFEDFDTILNIADECAAAGHPDRYYIFCSTSKITFPGSGISAMGSSAANIAYLKKLMNIQIISHDKVNQLRHVKYLKDLDGLRELMKKHAAILAPKFQAVLDGFQTELAPLDCCDWTSPKGGYFISFNTMPGCAKRVGELCKAAGVQLTGVGATFPYGIDPEDKNIRIAPSFPPVEELQQAVALFCLCVKIASLEHLLGK